MYWWGGREVVLAGMRVLVIIDAGADSRDGGNEVMMW